MTSASVVAVYYRPEYMAPTFDGIDRMTSGLDLRQRVFVANQRGVFDQLTVSAEGARANTEVISHDNTAMEFGAYQAGLNHLAPGFQSEWLIIANDTFTSHKNFARVTKDRFEAELAISRAHPTVIGHVDAITRSYRLNGIRTNRWVRTHVFALNRLALESLNWRVHYPELDDLVPGGADPNAFFSSELDPVLRRHLMIWLFHTEPGPHWYASEPLTAVNAPKMAAKARSILYEKYLSAALDGVGAEFVNLSDLPATQKIARKLDDKLFELKKSLRNLRSSG